MSSAACAIWAAVSMAASEISPSLSPNFRLEAMVPEKSTPFWGT